MKKGMKLMGIKFLMNINNLGITITGKIQINKHIDSMNKKIKWIFSKKLYS